MAKKLKCWRYGKDAWTSNKGEVISIGIKPLRGKPRKNRKGGYYVFGIKSPNRKYKSQARKDANSYMRKHDKC